MYQDAKMYQDVPIPWNSMGQALENLDKLCTLRLMRYETCFRSKENLCVCVSFALVMKRKIANNGVGGRVTAATWPA